MKLIYYFNNNKDEFQLSLLMFTKSGRSLLGYQYDEEYWSIDFLFLTFNFKK